MKSILSTLPSWGVLVFALAVRLGSASTSPVDASDPLRQLAARIKAAELQAAAGVPVSSADMQRLLDSARQLNVATAQQTPEFARKYRAVMLELGRLQHDTLNSVPSVTGSRANSAIDIEALDQHGSDCASALGISTALPVSVTLAERGATHSSAWLRVLPAAVESLRISASSTTADPALEVFSSCGAAKASGSNDDSIGLDAALALQVSARQPLYVHLLNSGSAGNVLVTVQGTNGNLSGTVRDRDTGTPIEGAYVDLYATSGAILWTSFSASDGTYSIPYAPGDYYVVAQVPSYATQIYAGIDCAPGFDMIGGCDPANATIVTLSAGATNTGVDFSLDHGYSLQGQIRDAANNPLGGYVVLYNAAGSGRGSYASDQYGHFKIAALPPATYKLAVEVNGFDAQMYDHKDCGVASPSECNISQATPIVVSNADVYGLDFTLTPAASISGHVLQPNGQAPANTQVVAVPIAPTQSGGSAFVAADGSYRIGPLQPGSYRLYASPAANYFPMAFPNIDCATYDCRYELPNAAQIAISQPGEQLTADLHVHAIPPVTGRVTDAATGSPLSGVEIHTDSTFGFYSFPLAAVTDSNGNFSATGFANGNYYLWARSPDHVDQLYAGFDCEADNNFFPFFPCDLNNATQLNIAPGNVPAIANFQLTQSSAISGSVTFDAGPGSHIVGWTIVGLYDTNGNLQKSVGADANGHYLADDVPPGTYYAVSQSNQIYTVDQLWPATNCAHPCTPSLGQPIQVTAGATVSGIDFRIALQNAVVGRVSGPGGAAVNGALVDLFSASDASYLGSVQVDTDGYYITTGSLGDYFVATEAGQGYVDQVYQGISCPLGASYYGLCPLTNATAVTLSAANLQPTIVNFVLQRADPIFASSFE